MAKEQPGFITFVVIPLWGLVDNVFPEMEEATHRAEYNIINWRNHEETEEELKIYEMVNDDDDDADAGRPKNDQDINSHLAANAPGPRVNIEMSEEEKKGD